MFTPTPFPVRKWKLATNVDSPQGSLGSVPRISVRFSHLVSGSWIFAYLECEDRSCSENRLFVECEFPSSSSVPRPMSTFTRACRLSVRLHAWPSLDDRTQLQAVGAVPRDR
jgi:hypothetical protein